MVLTYHTWAFSQVPAAERYAVPLATGVDLFMVLSGYCLFLPVAKNPDAFSVRRFARNRLWRIVPAYYASIVFVVLLPELLVVLWRGMGRAATWQPLPDALQVLSHLTFTHSFSGTTILGINGSYWSLGLEMQFYLALPLVVLLFRRAGSAALTWATLAAAAIPLAVPFLALSPGAASVLTMNLPVRFFEFLLGVLAAVVTVRQHRAGRTLGPNAQLVSAGLAVAVLLLAVFAVPATRIENLWLVTASIGYTLLLLAFALASDDSVPLMKMFGRGLLRRLGLVSYSFYLVHQPMEWFFSQFLLSLHIAGYAAWAAQLLIGGSLVGAVAWAGYTYVEQPAIKRGRKPPFQPQRAQAAR